MSAGYPGGAGGRGNGQRGGGSGYGDDGYGDDGYEPGSGYADAVGSGYRGQGRDARGYDDAGYDDDGYDSRGDGGRGARGQDGGRRTAGGPGGGGRVAGTRFAGDPGGTGGRGAGNGRGAGGYGASGYGSGGYDAGGYGTGGYSAGGGGWPDPRQETRDGQSRGLPRGRPGQEGRADRQARPGAGSQDRPGSGPQPSWQSAGPGPARRGTGPARPPSGTGPRQVAGFGAAGGYQAGDFPPDQGRYGRDEENWGGDGRDPQFLPGFTGSGDDQAAAAGRRGSRAGRVPEYEDGYDEHFSGRDGERDLGAGDEGGGHERRHARGGRARRGVDRDGRDGDGRDGRRPRRGPVRRLAPWVALLAILVPLVWGGLYAYNRLENKLHPADYAGPGTGPAVMVQIKNGDTAFTLAPRLLSLGVVASTRAFEVAAEQSTSTIPLEAGFYKLNHHMQASLAYAALVNPKDRVQDAVTLPEGLRLVNIIAVLGQKSGIPLSDFQAVLKDPAQLGLPSYASGKPEGYLFPATYQIQPNDTALSVLKEMVARFNQEAASVKLTTAASTVHLAPAQVIVVASLVQAEGGSVSDFPKIAEVVYNRLAQGIALHFDSTVFYGLGKYGTRATQAEIDKPGPYNTYLNKGLPPGPIDSPGAAAINAALHPATGNLLYFEANSKGVTTFSPTPLAGQ